MIVFNAKIVTMDDKSFTSEVGTIAQGGAKPPIPEGVSLFLGPSRQGIQPTSAGAPRHQQQTALELGGAAAQW